MSLRTIAGKGSILKVTATSEGVTIDSGGAGETETAARGLAELIRPGTCVALYGQLGSGKTVFARGLIYGLGVGSEVHVTSPTFVIVSEYLGRLPIHHVDAYRLSGPPDIVSLGSRELFFEDAVSVVEWADRIEEALPEDRLDVRLEVTGTDSRRITVSAPGESHGGLPGRLGEILAAEKEGGP